ncbi:MAG: hypothetical protein LW630_10735 [Saprospiraceae bacterium]|jgi:hypothetical protein|nr:hypothetical protein [Saprospiraceae bacterium]
MRIGEYTTVWTGGVFFGQLSESGFAGWEDVQDVSSLNSGFFDQGSVRILLHF